MGYQALLYCLDDKLARVVTQVFSELDFTVEPVSEPFSAVKKLMAQRYDAIVVDCENEPNATLLFKSARNSSSNQSSLALALVEGQAGVAKAYRIGANLVLTKPINVEQAKGTLRVARGLLRKNLDAAGAKLASPAAAPKIGSVAGASKPATEMAEPAAHTKNIYEAPEFEPSLPTMAASANSEAGSFVEPAPQASRKPADSFTQSLHQAAATEHVKPIVPDELVPSRLPGSGRVGAPGAAAAPAPAKEIPVPAENTFPAARHVDNVDVSSSGSPKYTDAPSFGALGDEESGGSGGSKKILLAIAAVFIVAALGYFGWTKLSPTTPSVQPSTAPSTSTSTPAPASTAPVTSATTTESVSASPSSAQQSVKPSATITATPAIKISAETEPIAKKPASTPIVVKSTSTPKVTPTQAEESAPQLPSPLAVASPNEKNLSGLVTSVPVSLPKAVPSTIKVSQGVSTGLLIKRVQPRYPQNALSMRIQGAVLLEATINKEGSITNLKVVSGDATLARAATEAVRQWRYKPYYLNGDPVDIQTQITVNFKLPN